MQPSIPDFCPACDPTLEKTEATRLVHDDGAEILFAATRELLIQLTSRSRHGKFVLPGVSFVGGGSRVGQQ
jgi:hypothetical protein